MTAPTHAQIKADNRRLRSALADMVEITKNNSSPEIILTAVRTCASHALTAAAEVGEPGIGGPTAEQVHNIMNATIERCAQWHDEQERLFRWRAVEQLKEPCPLEDVSMAQDQVADFHKQSAAAIRAMKDQP